MDYGVAAFGLHKRYERWNTPKFEGDMPDVDLPDFSKQAELISDDQDTEDKLDASLFESEK